MFSVVVFRFFIPATMANNLRLRRISIPDFLYPLTVVILAILVIDKEPVYPFKC